MTTAACTHRVRQPGNAPDGTPGTLCVWCDDFLPVTQETVPPTTPTRRSAHAPPARPRRHHRHHGGPRRSVRRPGPGRCEVALTPPVIVTVPPELGPVEVLVRHEEWGVEVDVRPAGTRQSWTPLALMGGQFEVRSA